MTQLRGLEPLAIRPDHNFQVIGEPDQPHSDKKDRALLPLEAARANHLQTDWDTSELAVPWFLGRRVVEPTLDTLIPYIDWTFLLSASEPKGDGGPTRELYDNARRLLDRIVAERRVTARGVYGFWPAHAVGDDIVVYKDDARRVRLATFHMLRQQEAIAGEGTNRSLADFVAPRESLAPDYIGAFAATAGLGAEELATEFEALHDDQSARITRALADRLAEAFGEYLHQQVRRDWGYESGDELSAEALIGRTYRGIRPAFGNSACPDHSERTTLFSLLDAPAIGMALTESFAMLPPASVSGLYFSHPEAKYFDIGCLGRDQVADYAARKGVSVEQAERWLGPNLGY